MQNVRKVRGSLFLAAACIVAAACSSAPARWTDTSETDPAPGAAPGSPGAVPGSPGAVPGSPGAPPPPPSTIEDGGADGDPSDGVDAAIYATPVQCTSGATGGAGNDALMQPGSACRTCHVLGGSASGKTWDIAGTVYPTAHEPDNCNGAVPSGVTIVITDANGAQTSLPVNGVGNFYHADLFGFGKIPTPYTAKVVSGGKVRAMLTPQTEGDCNSCHTVSGTMLAPGRIMLP
ncbi:MAG TPA: hypothetical protein VIF62_24930 [Labilithrix sp.]|jgi:hypothetical protein